jgi:RimJ/RimL family protein N-acetyltransferase
MPTHTADPAFSPALQTWASPAFPSQAEWPDPLAAPETGDALCAAGASLAPWRVADAPRLAALLSDESLWRWLPEPDPGTLDTGHARVLVTAANAAPHQDIVRALWREGQAQGQVRVNLAPCGQRGEISYWLGRDARGSGLGGKMVCAAIVRAFANLPRLKRLNARVHRANLASARVLAKVGFAQGPADGDWNWLHLRRRSVAV